MSRATGVKSHLSRYEGAWEAINRLIRSGGSWSGFERSCFFAGLGAKGFVNQSAASGLDYPEDGRGLAVWDYDGDGDPDLLVKNRNGPQVRILRNDSGNAWHRLKVRLEGRKSNRQAVGARVVLRHGGASRVKELRAGSGFLSQNSPELFFGLGSSKKADRLEVYWPSGLQQTFLDVPAGGEVVIREGEEKYIRRAFQQGKGRVPAAVVRPAAPPAVDKGRRAWLLDPVPLPPVKISDIEGVPVPSGPFSGAPFVLNLWTPECSSCLQELGEWSRLRVGGESSLPVLAITSSSHRESKRVADIARKAGFPIAFTSPEDLLAIAVLVEEVVRWPRQLRLPCTLLLDSSGKLVRLYEGRVSWAQLRSDAASIPADAPGRLAKGLPFAGTYYASDWYRNEFQLGVSYLEAGMAGYGLKAFERTLRRRPGETEALYNIGLIHLQAGDLEPARKVFEQALESQPDFVDAAANLGVVFARQGSLREAYAVFTRVLELRPGHIEVLMNTGNIEMTVGFTERAVRRFEEVIRLEPGLVAAYKRLGSVYRAAGDLDRTRKVYEKAVEINPADPELWSNLGVILAEQGRYREARKMCEKSVELSPGYAAGYNNLGLILQALDDTGGAIKAFSRSVALDPRGQHAQLNLAKLYLKLGMEDEARSLLEACLKLEPGNRDVIKLLDSIED